MSFSDFGLESPPLQELAAVIRTSAAAIRRIFIARCYTRRLRAVRGRNPLGRWLGGGYSGDRLPPLVFTMKRFEDLYHQHVGAVFRFAMSIAGRSETAEDLTSEAFLALYRNLDSIDDTRLPGWLLTVVRN